MPKLTTHCFDISQDMYVDGKGHDLEDLHYENGASQLVALLRCFYDNELYRITIERVEQENED